MMLQSSLKNPNAYLSSALSYSRPVGPKAQSLNERKRRVVVVSGVRCSVSQVHSYGTVDFENRPPMKWSAIYRRISLNEDPSQSCGSLLEQWEREYKPLTKWELCRVVKELRNYRKYTLALQVYEWMGNREDRFRLSSSDVAIQLDFIGKVHGIAEAEKFFLGLSESLRDKRVYGAMLNSYVRAKEKEKAESLLDEIRARGYATHCLPLNVMMTLYRNLKEYEKVEALTSEMIAKNINLDVYSYNIWMSSRGAQGSVEGMEEVFEKMRSDETVNPNWTTFSTMATMYIKMGLFEKAEECLRKVESRITGRDRAPYHFLLSLYGGINKKDEVYRIWNAYKIAFHTIPNMGYHAMFSSLLRLGDIEESEKIYEEWLQVKSSYDPRIGNLFMGYYVANGNLEKALSFVDHIAEVGGKPNSGSWEALAAGLIAERKVSEALSYWRKAFAAEGSNYWRPKPYNVSAFLELCDAEADLESKEVLAGMLKEAGHLKDGSDPSEAGLPQEAVDEESTLALY